MASGSRRESAHEIEPCFLTLDQVSKYLNVSGPQVYSLVRCGDLPAIKIGGRGVWRVERQRLERWIDDVHEQTAEWVRSHPPIDASRPRRLRLTGPRPLPDHAEAVTTAEAADMIGVTRQNVSHLIQRGSLRARKPGTRWLVSADDARVYQPLGSIS